VRHGESRAASAAAPFALVDGQGDPELHANGELQALKVGERLRSLPIDAIYVTKLQRTAQTAAPLAAHLSIDPILDPDLHEIHLGAWEGGLLRMKAQEKDPLYERMLIAERWDLIPGAEPWEQINARVLRGLTRIHRAHPDGLVVAVLHGGIIGHILAHAGGARPFAFQGADNASISHIVMVEGRIVVRRFNDASHLTQDPTGLSGALS